MTTLIFIVALLCLSGVAFGTGAVRALARIILIGGGAAAAVVAALVVYIIAVHP